MQPTKERRLCIGSKVQESVISFLSREDNSRTQPGKADVKQTSDGEKRQTLVLTDYLKNLHEKYAAENPEIKLSFATFCRLRPKNILLARFISRKACQCIHHQNMAFKVQAMRRCGVKISDNPENILAHERNLNELFECIEQEKVKYRIWKRVELDNKQKKMKVVVKEVSHDEFVTIMKEETQAFSNHVFRLRSQFQQLKKNKETLKDHEMIIQMDFAENFACRSLDEIQTAYWNQTSVTLHPIVAYFRSDGKLKHKSFVIVSDEMSHSASTVATFIDAVIPELKTIDPQLKKLHYWTDSPSSQYRNRYMFNLIANHMETYGCIAQWNFFEAGHGKSACDGLGGTTKRLADEAIRQGNTTIQDAQEFYQWAQKSNMKEVSFIFVEKEKCKQKSEEFTSLKIKPVRNTMTLHAIAISGSVYKTKQTSCYCEECQSDRFCSSWAEEQYTEPALTEQNTVNIDEHETQTNDKDVLSDLEVGEYIAVKYDSSVKLRPFINAMETAMLISWKEPRVCLDGQSPVMSYGSKVRTFYAGLENQSKRENLVECLRYLPMIFRR